MTGRRHAGWRPDPYGPSYFLQRGDNLFLIAEMGDRYKLTVDGHKLPGKIAVGGWYDTNHFESIDGSFEQSGNEGVYATFDQILWRPHHRKPVPAGTPGYNGQSWVEEEFPGGIGLTASAGWADPSVNLIDGNALVGVNWTGPIPGRKIDVFGVGASWAHLSHQADRRDPYELAIEAFYRIRFTQWISLKPDLQYILHPDGSGAFGKPIKHECLGHHRAPGNGVLIAASRVLRTQRTGTITGRSGTIHRRRRPACLFAFAHRHPRTGTPTVALPYYSTVQSVAFLTSYRRRTRNDPQEVLKLCKEKQVQFIDLRFMDFPGLWQHTTCPISELTLESFEHGFGFDGSSIRGWQAINE